MVLAKERAQERAREEARLREEEKEKKIQEEQEKALKIAAAVKASTEQGCNMMIVSALTPQTYLNHRKLKQRQRRRHKKSETPSESSEKMRWPKHVPEPSKRANFVLQFCPSHQCQQCRPNLMQPVKENPRSHQLMMSTDGHQLSQL
jgi:hypothetical protein